MNLYDATVPIFGKHVGNVGRWLDKAVAYAEQKKFDPEILVNARLAPDQFNFIGQVQSACDTAKYAVAKLTGKEPPNHPDTERTIAELRQRAQKLIDYLGTFKRENFNGAEERPCNHTWMQGQSMRGEYLDHHVLPNFHFHMTTAYDILRHNGVPLGKSDYLHDLPFIKK